MAKRPLDLIFPALGLNRRFAYRAQPPFSTPDCLNVWPVDAIEGRERGGSRPGSGKAFYEELGSGAPVRLAADLTYYRTDGFTFWADAFEGESLGSVWSVASWIGTAPPILPNNASAVVVNNAVGAVRDAIADLDSTKSYVVEIFVAPWEGGHKGKFQIYGRMNVTTPIATTDGFVAELVMEETTGIYSGTLKVYNATSETSYTFTAGASPIGYAAAGWFKVLVNGNNVSVFWLGNTEINAQDISGGLGGSAGHRVGFGAECTVAGGFSLIDTFRTQYFKTTPPPYTKQQRLVASAGGTLYYEDTLGTLSALGGNVDLGSDFQLQADSRAQKLYIADFDKARIASTGASGVISGASNNVLDDPGVADWTALGIDVDNDVVVITTATGPDEATSKITSVVSGQVNLTTNLTAGGNCNYRIERAPKVYDPAAGTLAIWFATTGQVPSGCPLVARFRDAMYLGGAEAFPHLWYKSRGGAPLDFDYSLDDALAALPGQDSEAGEIGAPLTAMIPFSDDYMIMGHTTELWMLKGDPQYGGRIINLSQELGIIYRGAWARGPSGEVFFLARQGAFLLPPGAGSFPIPLSEEPLPNELLNVDTNLYDVSCEYDAEHKGFHIYLAGKSATSRLHWFVDWRNKGFFPMQLPSDMDPTVTLDHVSESAEQSGLLMGCRDGFMRRYRRPHETDEGTEISSYITYGPLRLAGHGFREGILQEISGVLARDSGEVDWSLFVGDAHEDVLNKTAFPITGTWNRSGLNYKSHPRARGGSMLLKLANGESDRRWAIERVSAIALPSGEQKVG